MTIWPRRWRYEPRVVQPGEPECGRYTRWLAEGTLAMVERGGPTTQAGIHYQNSVAALCLGDLLRWDVVNPAERVVEVRLEAPADVDDIVVCHADGHRDWIQVKLDLEPRGNAWEKPRSEEHTSELQSLMRI